MKRLWIELQRWSRQRLVRCMDCNNDPMNPERVHPGRLRKPIAYQLAEAHRATTGHLVVVRLG